MRQVRTGFAAFLTLLPVIVLAQNYDEARLIALARAAVVAEVKGEPPAKSADRSAARPVFVTIEIGGVVRGCRGDLATRAGSLEQEIILAARSAAAHDPRYRPLSRADLKNFLVTVTVVDRMEPMSNISLLTPEDGLVLRSAGRTGIVLPWEGKDPMTRLNWAYRKAGVAKTAPVSLQRLVAQRFRG